MARAETTFMSCAFPSGINLQCGYIITGKDEEMDILTETHQLLEKSINVLLPRDTKLEDFLISTNSATYHPIPDVSSAVNLTFPHRSLVYTSESLLLLHNNFEAIPNIYASNEDKGYQTFALNLHPLDQEPSIVSPDLFPTIHDESFPVDDDDIKMNSLDYWLQWSLAYGGVGLGFMFSEGKSIEIKRLDVNQSKALQQVRSKLLDYVDHKTIIIDDGRRVLLYASLCKLSAQLRLLDETFKYLNKFEVLVHAFGDPFYQAMAARFRLDYGDWSDTYVDPISPIDESLPKEIKKLLCAKRYFQLAELTVDVNFRRDSIKKLMNAFTEIGQSQTVMEERAKWDEMQWSKFRERSIEKLKLYTTKEIDEKERNDPSWIREFSYARAVYYVGLLSKVTK